MTPWVNFALVLVDLVVLSALVIWLHSLSSRYGLAPLLLCLAATVVIVHTLGPMGVFVEAGGLVMVILSAVLVPATLLGILLIYAVQGTAAARVTIFSVLGVSVLALGLHLVQGVHLALPGVGDTAGLAIDSAALTRSPSLTFASLMAFVLSLTAVAVVYQAVSNRWPDTPVWLTAGISLTVALWTDAVVFQVAAFGWSSFVAEIPRVMASRTVSALVVWPMAGWYLARGVPALALDEEARDRKALDLLFGTYGRQAEMLSLMQQARRTTEDALRRAESRLSAVISNAPIVFFALDREGRFTLSEGKGLETLGLQPGQVVGQSVFDLYPEVTDVIHRVMNGESVTTVLEVAGQVWGTTYTPVTGPDGTVEGITGVATDLTERTRVERALRDSERRFRHTFEQAAVGIAHVHPSGRFLRVNQRLASILGYSQEELLEKNFQSVTHPDDMARSMDRVQQALAGALDTFSLEKRYVRKDGSLVWANTTGALLRGEDGEPRYFVQVVEDITARKATEEQLRQSQKMEVVGQLTGGVAHDFNNLMTVIMGGVELAREEVEDRPEAASALDSALEATRRGAALTQRLLAFSRKQTLRPTAIDPRSMLLEMTDLLATSVGETVDLRIDVEPGLWSLVGDRSQVENVILNLALNSRDAMPGGGHLRIRAANAALDDVSATDLGAEPGQYVLLEVEDDGCGMTPETMEHAFEPFFTTKDVGKGSGLGLSMVYGFVNQSGGQVHIDSEPGRGTRVQLFMPRAGAGEDDGVSGQNAGPEPTGNREMILVVEDDHEVRRLVVRLLDRLSYRCLEAEDAAGALELLASRPDIDLLFTDIMLPGGMTGAALAQEAQKQRPDLRVVYTSGYSRDALSNEGRLEAGVDLVEKPFEKSQLASVLADVLSR